MNRNNYFLNKKQQNNNNININNIIHKNVPIPMHHIQQNAMPFVQPLIQNIFSITNIKTIDLFASRFVENIINALAKIIEECGIKVNVFIRNISNEDIIKCIKDTEHFMFICCPQTLLQCVNGPVYPAKIIKLPPNKYFLYQLEQLDINNPKFLNPCIISLILNSRHTFDYSDINLNHYPMQVKDKVSKLIPPIVVSALYINKYHITLEPTTLEPTTLEPTTLEPTTLEPTTLEPTTLEPTTLEPTTLEPTTTKKTIDVLFCGHINERRTIIIGFLKLYGINVQVKTNAFGKELTKLISQAKIVLNIRNNDTSDVLETCRLHEALMSISTHIVSEPVKNTTQMELYKGRVIFTNDLLHTIKRLLTIGPEYNSWLNYYKINHLTETALFNTLNVEYENKKVMHRHNCYSNLPLIKNVIIPDIALGLKNETVLIEFRPMPHVDFLLRNTIIKFPDWSHTVVCGNLNYDFIKSTCQAISQHITIIRLNVDNLLPSDYSELLMTIDFWLSFKGEKILLYQEDTMLFHNRIDEFLKYDYIGASWPKEQDDNSQDVGNGGFSLRTKEKMIKCLANVNPYTDLELGKSTLSYMKNTNSYRIPEDVYFSKALIDFKLGLVAMRDVANRFSQETQLCTNPLGGHNFWLAEGNTLNSGVKLQLETDYHNTVTHRGGWKNIITSLLDSNIVSDIANKVIDNININNTNIDNKNTVKIIDCIESRFLWNANNNTPMKEKWIGVIHYSPHLPRFIKDDLDYLLNNPFLIQSLPLCKGIIVFSKNSKNYIKKHFAYKHINITSIKHPCETIPNKFSFEKFLQKKNYNVIQLGLQDRKVTTIYTLKTNYKKMWLSGITQKNKIKYALEQEANYLKIQINNINLVVMPYFSNHTEYDNMLQNNIVIIPLWSASANNSIMEIIEMNIPAFVTRLAATEEYLGKEYPMFYTHDIEIEQIINDRQKLHAKYKETYNYLLHMDKREFTLDYFKSELVKFSLMG